MGAWELPLIDTFHDALGEAQGSGGGVGQAPEFVLRVPAAAGGLGLLPEFGFAEADADQVFPNGEGTPVDDQFDGGVAQAERGVLAVADADEGVAVLFLQAAGAGRAGGQTFDDVAARWLALRCGALAGAGDLVAHFPSPVCGLAA